MDRQFADETIAEQKSRGLLLTAPAAASQNMAELPKQPPRVASRDPTPVLANLVLNGRRNLPDQIGCVNVCHLPRFVQIRRNARKRVWKELTESVTPLHLGSS